MNIKQFNRMVLILLLLLLSAAGAQAQGPLGTTFTYQGRLVKNGSAVTDTCDFEFGLWTAASGGAQLGTDIVTGVPVSEGYFSVELDFGDTAFTGDKRYLQIGVRCPGGSGSYTALNGRVPLNATPYALALPGLWTQQNATSPNVIGGYSGNIVSDGVDGATIAGGGRDGSVNQVTANLATVGGGQHNTASNWNATVGGGISNTASGWSATVGGGHLNTASGVIATVGGGQHNTASGGQATVGGGEHNTASGGQATVGGGVYNRASGAGTTVGGGRYNRASGYYATVPGGEFNTATANYSFAAGQRAKANHDGTFVWADSTNEDFASTGEDQFLIRAGGGVGIVTNSTPITPSEALEVAGFIKSGSTAFGRDADGSPRSHGNYANFGSNNHGTTLVANNLYVDNSDALRIANTHTTMAGAAIKIPGNGQTRQNYIEFWTTPTGSVTADAAYARSGPQMVIDAPGKVGIGIASPTHLLHVNGVARSAQSTWVTSSDGRVKTNIQPLTGSLEKILELNPVSFEYIAAYKGDNPALDGRQVGFIAQEVAAVEPGMVTTVEETFGDTSIEDFHVLDSSNLIPMLVDAVKELKAENDAQQAVITDLQQQNTNLEARVAALETRLNEDVLTTPGFGLLSGSPFSLGLLLVGMGVAWFTYRRQQGGK